jgi:hypothetical protein
VCFISVQNKCYINDVLSISKQLYKLIEKGAIRQTVKETVRRRSDYFDYLGLFDIADLT